MKPIPSLFQVVVQCNNTTFGYTQSKGINLKGMICQIESTIFCIYNFCLLFSSLITCSAFSHITLLHSQNSNSTQNYEEPPISAAGFR